jgi:hypothetical protein
MLVGMSRRLISRAVSFDDSERSATAVGRRQMGELRVHEIKFEDPIDFVDALDHASGLFIGSTLYRGQADSTWSLSPSAFRDNIPYILDKDYFPPDKRAYGTQVKLEIELLWLFVARADSAGLVIPGETERVRELIESIRRDGRWVADPKKLRTWPPRELFPALSLAQHDGIPTRLLDWTYDSRVAIYFAAEGAARAKDRSGRLAVWVCKPKEDRVSVWGAPSLEIARPSSAFNANLRAQRGCLMIWRKGAAPEQLFNRHSLEEELSAEAERAGVEGASIFIKLTLPQTQSGPLLQWLSLHQIDGATIFPGFDGVGRVVRERIYWDGYEGTGAVGSWDKELRKRMMKRNDKWMRGAPIYHSSYEERAEKTEDFAGEYGGLRMIVEANRNSIEAGDYDPNLARRIVALEEAYEKIKLKASPLILKELADLIAKMKSLV